MTVKKAAAKAPTKAKPAPKKPNGVSSRAGCKRATKTVASKAASSNAAAKKKSPVSDEKRQHLRLHYSRLVSFLQYDASKQVEKPAGMAAIKNLSEAGILIEVGGDLHPGDPIDLDIAFDQDKIIPARGEVVYTRKIKRPCVNVGIKFTKISKKDLTYLKKFIAQFGDEC